MKAEDYRVDPYAGTISPVAAGQKFTHRELGGQYIVGFVEYQGTGLTVWKDEKLSDSMFAAVSEWTHEAEMFRFLAFAGWAYNGPAKSDPTRFPHKCPRCQSAAYVGACGGGDVDCTNADCPTRKR